MTTPIFRFAPSPNGPLHLGHALSALCNQRLAEAAGGQCLLRIEDIDQERCRPEFITAAMEDLHWIGFRWTGEVLRQSTRFACYREALDGLEAMNLIYPCFCTRKQLATGNDAGGMDPDGTPLYDQRCKTLSKAEQERRIASGEPYALRLMISAAMASVSDADLVFEDARTDGTVYRSVASPAIWGDVVVARKGIGTSYHLSVVVDDAFQQVTHVVRGMDLHRSTDIQVLLQRLLGLPTPLYRHHPLVLDAQGQKLSKSRGSPGLADLRQQGRTAAEIRAQLGF